MHFNAKVISSCKTEKHSVIAWFVSCIVFTDIFLQSFHNSTLFTISPCWCTRPASGNPRCKSFHGRNVCYRAT